MLISEDREELGFRLFFYMFGWMFCDVSVIKVKKDYIE